MALPSSGNISLSQVNTELTLSATTQISLNDAAVRTLASKSSGQIAMSDLYGTSNRPQLTYTFSSNQTNASLNITSLSGYSSGKSDVTVVVNNGVYLYATSTGNAGLTLTGGASGDTLKLVNNGYIMGQGAVGSWYPTLSVAGGPALSLGFNTTIDNTNGSAYIGGGGGGGGAFPNNNMSYAGGGGAGGGNGGGDSGYGVGGGPGSSGTSATGYITDGTFYFGFGGGGGRIFPGTGGAGADSNSNIYGQGGGAGGGGGAYNSGGITPAGAGGSANNQGGDCGYYGAGGGGGWGAAGGYSQGPGYWFCAGGAGGKAVNLNGNSVTWVSGNTTRVYGAVA